MSATLACRVEVVIARSSGCDPACCVLFGFGFVWFGGVLRGGKDASLFGYGQGGCAGHGQEGRTQAKTARACQQPCPRAARPPRSKPRPQARQQPCPRTARRRPPRPALTLHHPGTHFGAPGRPRLM